MNKVTVIIPAYNAEKTVGRTIKSLLAQTLPVDIVVVDDGSTDATARMAGQYGVKVVHQKNSGAYTARITGLKETTTPYFGFVDADDVVEPVMYEHLVGFAEAHDLDVAQCDFVGSGLARGQSEEVFCGRSEVISRIVYPTLIEGVDSSFVWDKIYRTESCRCDFVDSSIMMGDDLAMNLQLFESVSRVGHLHEELYHYQVTDGSSVRRFNSRMVGDFYEIIRLRKLFIPRYEIEIDPAILNKWIVKNGWNFISSAITARTENEADRETWIRQILACPELTVAIQDRGVPSRRSFKAWLVKMAYILPIPIFIFLMRSVMRVARTF